MAGHHKKQRKTIRLALLSFPLIPHFNGAAHNSCFCV